MRTALILAFATAIAASTVVACAVEQPESNSIGSRKSSKKSSSKSSDADDTSDDGVDDSVGNTSTPDPTNPNANTAASAPVGTGTAAQGFALTMGNATPTIDLASTSELTVTVEPKNGFTGNVALTVDGLPDGVTASPASGAPGSPITIKLTSSATAPVTPTDGKVELTIKGTSGSQTATALANFKVLPKITMTVPTNSQALLQAGGTHFLAAWGDQAFADGSPLLTQTDNPIVVTVKNEDSTARTVHGDNGFKHGAGPIAPGETDSTARSIKPGVNGSGYLHGVTNGTAVGFKFIVKATP
jgi:hypothetical protein